MCHSLQWMRFLGWLEEPFVPPPHPYTAEVAEFLDWARADRGYAEGSIENFFKAANDFLSFVAEFGSGDSLASITPSDIDRYFVRKASLQSFARPTIASRAYSLRMFFTFAERRDYCRRGHRGGDQVSAAVRRRRDAPEIVPGGRASRARDNRKRPPGGHSRSGPFSSC